jgi:hypothetical protein
MQIAKLAIAVWTLGLAAGMSAGCGTEGEVESRQLAAPDPAEGAPLTPHEESGPRNLQPPMPRKTVLYSLDECDDGPTASLDCDGGGGGGGWPPNPYCNFTVSCGTWEVPSGGVSTVAGPNGTTLCCQWYDKYYGCTYVWADCSTTTTSSKQGSDVNCWPEDEMFGC